jgi:tetratricopeptide (TPR) repeat protein
MFCKNCSKEIPDDSVFCNVCGKKQKEIDSIDITENETEEHNKSKIPNKKIILYGVIGIALVLVIVILFILNNNPVNVFMQSINENKYSEAVSIYDEKISGHLDKEKEIEDELGQKINSIVEEFKSGKVDYEKTKVQLDTIKETKLLKNEVNDATREVNNLHDSRIAFNKGLEFNKSNNYLDTIIEFRKVIESDDNYSIAQNNINQISSLYKTEVLKEIDSLANNENYDEAMKKINEVLRALPNDTDLIAKLTNYEKLAKDKKEEELNQQMIKLENEQEVAVTGVSEYTDSINTNFIAVTVENRTEKRVKSYSIGFMGFDKNGLPVKVGLGGGKFVGGGYNDQNILPGESKYSNGGWYLDNHDVVTLLACIAEVEYYEGDTWKNPYYELWIEKYAEKPLE